MLCVCCVFHQPHLHSSVRTVGGAKELVARLQGFYFKSFLSYHIILHKSHYIIIISHHVWGAKRVTGKRFSRPEKSELQTLNIQMLPDTYTPRYRYSQVQIFPDLRYRWDVEALTWDWSWSCSTPGLSFSFYLCSLCYWEYHYPHIKFQLSNINDET